MYINKNIDFIKIKGCASLPRKNNKYYELKLKVIYPKHNYVSYIKAPN